MKKIILVSATEFEIEPTLLFLKQKAQIINDVFIFKNLQISFCITKVGMVNTAFELGKLKGKHFDIAINIGVCGSYGSHSIGQVLNVTQDQLSELGAESNNKFISIDDLGFGKQIKTINYPFNHSLIRKLPEVKGITVNTVHGNLNSINKIIKQYNPDVETMEGAAFIHAANEFKWPALQLRAVSNLVEVRNIKNWDLPLAIKKLNLFLISLIKKVGEEK